MFYHGFCPLAPAFAETCFTSGAGKKNPRLTAGAIKKLSRNAWGKTPPYKINDELYKTALAVNGYKKMDSCPLPSQGQALRRNDKY